jgi:hypothetical protein
MLNMLVQDVTSRLEKINIEVPSPSLNSIHKLHEVEQYQNVHKDTVAHTMNIMFLGQE